MAVSKGSQPRPRDQRRIRTVRAEVYAPPGTGVMTFPHAMAPPRPPVVRAAQAPPPVTFLAVVRAG